MKGWKSGLLLIGLFLMTVPDLALACPLISGLLDFNCDEAIKVSVVGDSVVRGTGDLLNNNRGGYVKRLDKRFKKPKFENLGLPGYTTERIFSEFKSKLNAESENKIKSKLTGSDLIIVDAGRNDFFDHADPELTLRNLRRIVAMLRKEVGKLNGGNQPFVVVATLIPTTRGFQRSFIDNVNLLIYEFNSGVFPVGLYFDQIPEEFISVDGIHPASEGYDFMAEVAEAALLGSIEQAEMVLRPDTDDDGIFDRYERRFETDPKKKDSDRDGLSDGSEVFTYLTDPLIADTDGDGADDGTEITNGTDPLIP